MKMKIRIVQIFGFLFTVLGWIFVSCTMAMEYWKICGLGGLGGNNIISIIWYWSSLWRACYTDSTAVTDCIDFPVLWAVDNHIQIVRGLLISALVSGLLAIVLALIGMECTYIGGKEKIKHKFTFAGGVFHILSGLSSFSGYVVYANNVSGEYFNPAFQGLKFNLGTPLFLGWVGSMLCITGGIFYSISVGKLVFEPRVIYSDSEGSVRSSNSGLLSTSGDPREAYRSQRTQFDKNSYV
nr:PREDICTED: claudin-10-like [Lepisosteus oculatus]